MILDGSVPVHKINEIRVVKILRPSLPMKINEILWCVNGVYSLTRRAMHCSKADLAVTPSVI
jgi:aspartate carbamoyltransferase regulatory subunit